PLGLHDNDLLVSFTIFSKGNINNPTIRKSAGDKNLDSIAVRAIIDSAPFPELPEELHRPNLKVIINFKYVPE
ncbi:MAG: TonB C-terminal domain-containing protein, partial [Rhodospirillales bacterium]|nr:TonB C-terminal domain-containing protein [Rhodospirillales bacterium]